MFDELYSKLNKEQKLAVDTIEGPVMVVAGPGTGKTQIIAMRIANILQKTDMRPENILALTFTESGVHAMKKRLHSIIGKDAYNVQIHTFHSFCNRTISDFPEKFIEARDLKALTDVDRILILKKIIDNTELKYLTTLNNKYFYLNEVSRCIQTLKRENFTSLKYEELINSWESEWEMEKASNPKLTEKSLKWIKNEKDIGKNKELLSIYRKFEDNLKKFGFYDFDDMILKVIGMMNHDLEFLRTYQEQFQYILVDEYQDTNYAQNEIVRLLASYFESPNVFFVGDDDQSIYRFQGASVENLLSLSQLYPDLKKIVLTQNYRSTQKVLDSSKSLIENNKQRITNLDPEVVKSLSSNQDYPEKNLQLTKFENGYTENYYLAKEIKSLIENNVEAHEIAVLTRDNFDLLEVAEALKKEEVAFELQVFDDVLDNEKVKNVIDLIRLIESNLEDNLLFHKFLSLEICGLDLLDSYKISYFVSKKRISYRRLFMEQKYFKELSSEISSPDKLLEIFKKLVNLCALKTYKTVSEFLDRVVEEFNWTDFVLNSDKKLKDSESLFTFLRFVNNLNYNYPSLSTEQLLRRLEAMKEYRVKLIRETVTSDSKEGVQLLTAHRSKGLEFDHVFIPKIFDGKWGNKRVRELIKLPPGITVKLEIDTDTRLEDERRLFFVALTRAKKQIHLSYAEKYNVFGNDRQVEPALFIDEIDSSLIDEDDNLKQEKAEKIIENLILPIGPIKSDVNSYLKSLLENFKMSSSALECYLRNPYRFVFDYLLKTPRSSNPTLAYGSAVHKALEKLHIALKKGRLIELNEFNQYFEDALKKEALVKDDYERALKRGFENLEIYYRSHRDLFSPALFVEKFIGFSDVFYKNVPIHGKIDRFDLVNKDLKQVRVVDYKTGKHRTRNEILGKTKSSDGRYFRQLMFYKLLTDSDPKFNYDVIEGQFEFVDPKDGKTRIENFEFNFDELQEFGELLVSTYQKILNLQFTPEETSKFTDEDKAYIEMFEKLMS